MPFKSKAQAALFYAAASGKATKAGLSQQVAQKFINDATHKPGSIKKLPEHVHKGRK